MKRQIYFIAVILILIISGCNPRNQPIEQGTSSEPANVLEASDAVSRFTEDTLLIAEQEQDVYSVRKLSVDLKGLCLSLNQEQFYTIQAFDDEWMPVFCNSEKIIFQEGSGEVNINEEDLALEILPLNDSEAYDPLYYKNYMLERRTQTEFILTDSTNEFVFSLPETMDFIDQAKYAYQVTAFSIYDEKIILLCVATTGNGILLIDTICYDINDRSTTIQCVDISETAIGISAPPISEMISANDNFFVIDAGSEIYLLDSELKTIEKMFYDKKLENDIKNLDTTRDFSAFFHAAEYKQDIYVLQFPAYNDLFGSYVTYYDNDCQLVAYLRFTPDVVSLYDASGTLCDELSCTNVGTPYIGYS